MNQGTIVQCIGAVIDVEFPREAMPSTTSRARLRSQRNSPRSSAAPPRS